MRDLPKDAVIGARIIEICHSPASEPQFVLEGIGPASFRSHFLRLESGLVVDLFVAEITRASISRLPCPGETDGIPIEDVIGRTITRVWRDDTHSCLVVLNGGIYLRDANDGVYGNSLYAGWVEQDYDHGARQEFTDYWTEELVDWTELIRL